MAGQVTVVAIGGNGFIGQHVVDQLALAGHRVFVLHRNQRAHAFRAGVEEIIGDANQLETIREELQRIRPDVVLNFVLSSGAQAKQMMSALRGIVGRVVAISSMDVYRACGILHRTEDGELQQLPLTEESQLRSAPAYSPAQMQAGKKIFSWMTDDYDKISVESAVLSDPQLPGTVLRLPMVYGCGDPLHRFLPVVKRIQDRRRTILLQDGLAQWRGPKGFVEDVAHAIALATVSNKAAGAIYNIAESDALTELEWARLIATEMRWTGNFVVLPHEKMPAHLASDANWTQHWVASSQRIRQELGYRERIPRADAVRRTVQWEVENAPAEAPAALFNYPAEDAAIEAHFSA